MDLDDAVFTSEPISIPTIGKICSAADDIVFALKFNGTAATVFGIRKLCNSSACFEGMDALCMRRLQ